MQLRRVPQTPAHLREGARVLPDEIHLSSFRTSWQAARLLVEARAGGRALGDWDFEKYADALAFAELECKWHGAKLVDECRKPGDA